MNKKAFSLIELLIGLIVLSFVTYYMYNNYGPGTKPVQTRPDVVESKADFTLITQKVKEDISRASYIYPSNQIIYLNNTNFNTAYALTMLVPATVGGESDYYVSAFYFKKNQTGLWDFCQFRSLTPYKWESNTLPIKTISNVSGQEIVLANNLNVTSSSLIYLPATQPSQNDATLKPQSLPSDSYALINGVDWKFTLKNGQELEINTISPAIPRSSVG